MGKKVLRFLDPIKKGEGGIEEMKGEKGATESESINERDERMSGEE